MGPAYRAECADGRVTISAQGGPEDEPEEEAEPDNGDEEDVLAVKEKRPAWAAFESSDVQRYPLPGDLKFRQVRVQHRDEPVSEGVEYLYLFPGGTAEVAAIQLTDGRSVYTLITQPLTGKVRIYPDAMDVEM
jgi:general secretion pathway protein H